MCEFIQEVEPSEWQAFIGPELHPHIYEFMPQRYNICFRNKHFKLVWARFGSCNHRSVCVCVISRVDNWFFGEF